MSTTIAEPRLTNESLELIRQVERSTYRRVLDRAVARAAGEGRTSVTADDVRASVSGALVEVAKEQGTHDAAESSAH